MKRLSRPINWSLLLVPLMLSAMAIPGTAHSQQRDRIASQQEHRRLARGEAITDTPTPVAAQQRQRSDTATRRQTASYPTGQEATRQPIAREYRAEERRPVADQSYQRRSRDAQGSRRDADNRDYGYRDRDNRGRESQAHRPRQPDRDQQRRISDEQQRADRYFAAQARQRDAAAQRDRALHQQRRNHQYRYQNQYHQRVYQQNARWSSVRYDYYSDPFYYTPASHRYQYGGQWHSTNRYGADLMRQAVDHGYQEGLRAGQADRQDGWRADYRGSYAYQDASYGYNGRYISSSEYQHYFRQGFQRGYQDGHANRYEYGYRRNDGSYAIVAAVLAAIVGLQLLN